MTNIRVWRLPYEHKEDLVIKRKKIRRNESNAWNKKEIARFIKESGKQLPTTAYYYNKYKVTLKCIDCTKEVSFKAWTHWKQTREDLRCYACTTKEGVISDNKRAIAHNRFLKYTVVKQMKRNTGRVYGQKQLYALKPWLLKGFRCVRCFDEVSPERVIMYKQVDRIYCEPCQTLKKTRSSKERSANWQKSGVALLPKREDTANNSGDNFTN